MYDIEIENKTNLTHTYLSLKKGLQLHRLPPANNVHAATYFETSYPPT